MGRLLHVVPVRQQGQPSQVQDFSPPGGYIRGFDDIHIAFLAQSSLVALVDIPPSRLSVIVVVNHEVRSQIIFISKSHQGHHGHPGGLQPPLPTMPMF